MVCDSFRKTVKLVVGVRRIARVLRKPLTGLGKGVSVFMIGIPETSVVMAVMRRKFGEWLRLGCQLATVLMAV